MRRCCAGIKIKAEQPRSSRPAPSPAPPPLPEGCPRSDPLHPSIHPCIPGAVPRSPARAASRASSALGPMLGSVRFCWAGLRSARFKRGEGAEEPGGGPGELRHCQPCLCRPRHRHRPPPLPSTATFSQAQILLLSLAAALPAPLPRPLYIPVPQEGGKRGFPASSSTQRMRYHPSPRSEDAEPLPKGGGEQTPSLLNSCHIPFRPNPRQVLLQPSPPLTASLTRRRSNPSARVTWGGNDTQRSPGVPPGKSLPSASISAGKALIYCDDAQGSQRKRTQIKFYSVSFNSPRCPN